MNKISNVLRISQELSGQWIIPVLLALEDCGERFTPLQRHLETTPARLSVNLKRMIEGGLIKHLSPFERHHPLFPEYMLTEKGRLYREAAETIQEAEAGMVTAGYQPKRGISRFCLLLILGMSGFRKYVLSCSKLHHVCFPFVWMN